MSILLYAGGKKRTLKQLFVSIRNNVHDWWMSFESGHLWIARIIVYFTCLAGVVLVCFILFCYFNLFHTDVTSARYMLSALVQSQAAIVAIVITLTLIAVQLTASAYSPRVIDIFKKNPDMWLLLGCYGFSIFYGFIVLKLVVGAEGEFVSQSAIWSLGSVTISFESCVSMAYWLGVFTFVALFPYMWNIIGLLKSETIIKRLAIEITREDILKEKAPLQPIVDIIHGSIMKYDLETTRVGLKAVTDQVIKIIDSDAGKEISMRFCGHLERVGRLAISREDEHSTVEVIKNLENFGKSPAERGLGAATLQAGASLGLIGSTAAEKGLKLGAWEAVMSLERVGITAKEKGLESATLLAAWSLGEVGKAATEKGLEESARSAAWSLGKVGEGLEVATKQAAESLIGVGIAAVKKGLEGVTGRSAWFLAELTISSEEIVKTVIQDYESDLEEKDRGSFQEFMKIYEYELKELRAENQNKKTESR
jgi:hypothetical protein